MLKSLQGVRKKVPLLIEILVGITLKIQLKEVLFFRTPCIYYTGWSRKILETDFVVNSNFCEPPCIFSLYTQEGY